MAYDNQLQDAEAHQQRTNKEEVRDGRAATSPLPFEALRATKHMAKKARPAEEKKGP